MAVLYLSSDSRRGEIFAESFARALPDLPFHIGSAPDPAAVEFLVAWTAPADLGQAYPNLRVIFSVGAGVDQLDLATVPPQVLVVRMLEPGIPQQMREFVALATLALHRDLPLYISRQRQALWQPGESRPAAERRVGVMGLGQLGQAVLDALAPFGFQLGGWSRSLRSLPGVESFTELPAFLSRTDILICLLPLTPETRGILDAGLFAGLPPGAGLVHVGRGGHLDQQALLAALDSGRLSAAWLDVTDPEPLPREHPLWAHPRVVITPHVATRVGAAEGAAHVIAGIRAYRAGRSIPGLVDRARGY
ncbi:glyoxylate/hydroxypyruvate reductase A [Tistlia consotensis]|uniref:Glyoxylate/hydroxypyruvate reductase A n=1 Tax=Tistlia consotensis USBA 355 TaxID=560819 RepID=A0A1Y6BVR9_9PROT|nr:glyoxylate/hydroxypyruvate reductase A [Tistlia consotensis]SMF30999.1 glyoxylate/hydroxypyruvate reductase A [Tistlia consotensis USBA 355]SNS19414.1 glyoxylate/hydroxypyruvate reductase A [Tistlia consotensis]